MIPTRKNISLPYLAAILCLALLLCGCQRISARFIGVQTLDPGALTEVLARQPAPLIIDLRAPAEFNSGHLPGAIRLAAGGLDGYMARSGLSLQQIVIVICESGWDSQIAAAAVAAAGYINTYSLNGGFAKLKEGGFRFESGSGPSFPEALLHPPVVSISTASQFAMAIAAFAVKPVYMLTSALIFIFHWRQPERELQLLRFSMLSFFLGEGACALNYLAAGNAGLWLEFFHGAGMVGTYALVFGAFFLFFGCSWCSTGKPTVSRFLRLWSL